MGSSENVEKKSVFLRWPSAEVIFLRPEGELDFASRRDSFAESQLLKEQSEI
jgi:hypothetical protein